MSLNTLAFARTIRTTPALAFRAWCRSGALCEWLCDGATIDARVGGRYVLWWQDGYLSMGAILSINLDRALAFTWHGTGDPAPTQVTVTLAPQGEAVRVQVDHQGVQAGEGWDDFREEITRGWETGLENLQSALETGEDLRVVRQPRMGVGVGPVDAEIAARLALPGVEGLVVDWVVPGLGAEEAGLRNDDVIVGIGAHAITGWSALGQALRHQRSGDVVELQYYRDGAKQSAQMRLSQRQMPEVAALPAGLAAQLRPLYDEAHARISALLAGVSAEATRARPAPREWSALETVAHLIVAERELHISIADAIADDLRWSDRYTNTATTEATIASLAAVYDTPTAMISALRHVFDETIALSERLPAALVERRATYLRLGRNLLELTEHTDDHVAQIRDALGAAGA